MNVKNGKRQKRKEILKDYRFYGKMNYISLDYYRIYFYQFKEEQNVFMILICKFSGKTNSKKSCLKLQMKQTYALIIWPYQYFTLKSWRKNPKLARYKFFTNLTLTVYCFLRFNNLDFITFHWKFSVRILN